MQDSRGHTLPRVRVQLSLIDPPSVAMRSEMTDEGLAELQETIAHDGLIYPPVIVRNGDRWSIIAGHRRYVVLQRLGWHDVECDDATGADIDLETIKIQENLGQERVSDADMAAYLDDLVTTKGYTMDDLMRRTRKSQHWLDTRIGLFRGNQNVYLALRAGKLNLSQCVALNRFPADKIEYYLHLALNSTPPAHVIDDWRRQMQAVTVDAQPVAESTNGAGEPDVPTGPAVSPCRICGGSKWESRFIMIRVHDHCWDSLERGIENARRGE